MDRTFARLMPQRFGRASIATRHREAPIRPCARALTRCAARVLGPGLVLLMPWAAPVRGAEVARDLAAAGTFLGGTGPDLRVGPRDDLPRPADLALVWYDPSGGLPAGHEALADEVRSIFRGLGVEASWRVGGSFGGAAMPEVPVILLLDDPVRLRRSQRVLGLVVPDQEPQRAVWVFLENLRLTLGIGRGPLDPKQADTIGRALGRVVAHEVVHAIAPDTPHAGEGLMRHALGKDFLLGRRAKVDARCASAFVARLAVEWQQARARTAAGNALP
jgi:hypothetical protein